MTDDVFQVDRFPGVPNLESVLAEYVEPVLPAPRVSETDILNIAAVCHAANREWCIANGDHSQVAWDQAPEWQQFSAIFGVRFLIEHPDASDDALHEQWVWTKISAGWKYGPVKDATARTHPCLVNFEALPSDQQAKDRLFIAVVRALTA